MTLDFPDWSNNITPGVFTLAGQAAKLVALTGTAVPLVAGLTLCKMVMVEARATNSTTVYLGSSTVTADETATGGLQLAPGAIIAFPVNDLHTVYVNGTAGDGVSFMFWT